MKKEIRESLTNQFNEMIRRGIFPLFEFELPDYEYLVVNLELHYRTYKNVYGCSSEVQNGLRFSFDQDGKKTYFDGEIQRLGDGVYMLPWEDCFECLDSYLEMISENITERFLLLNDLLV